MRFTEIALEQPAAEQSHHLAQDDLAGWPSQRIAARTARRNDESAHSQDAQELADVSIRNAFGIAELRDSQSSGWSFLPEADQASQSIFFMRREFHR
jgi:hypothetical protein